MACAVNMNHRGEAHPGEACHSDRDDDRLAHHAEERVGEAEQRGLPRECDGPAAEDRADVARELLVRVRGEEDRVGGQREGRDEAQARGEQHRGEDPGAAKGSPASA